MLMKRKDKEIGNCICCNKKTTKQLPKFKHYPKGKEKKFYCGCQGIRAL